MVLSLVHRGCSRVYVLPVLLALTVTLAVPLVHGEVTHRSASGFVSEHQLVLQASPADAYQALVHQVAAWWDASHSYSGEAAGFSIEDVAGGCFCEILGDVRVEHMRVVNVHAGRRITLHGALGPLQSMAVNGSMHFEFEPHDEGSLLKYRYSVGGYVPGGLDVLADAVDQVQLGQLSRLKRHVATNLSRTK